MTNRYPTLSLDREIVAGGIRRPVLVRGGEDGWRTLARAAAEQAPKAFLLVTPPGLPEVHTSRMTSLLGALAPVRRLTLDGTEGTVAAPAPGTVVVALGGTRVVERASALAARGHLAGHGTRLILAPSTPRALTDSALSVAHPGSRGFVPALVWAQLDLPGTLPPDRLRPGLAPLVRDVLAVAPAFRDTVAALLRPDRTGYDPHAMARAIALGAELRAGLTSYDPAERGPAMALHYGRTVAAALFALTTAPHDTPSGGAAPRPAPALHPGDATALGLRVAARAAVLLGLLSPGAERAHHELLARWGAPRELPAPLTAADVAAVLRRGGGTPGAVPAPRSGTARMVLLDDLGRPHVVRGRLLTEVDHEVLATALDTVEPSTAPVPRPATA